MQKKGQGSAEYLILLAIVLIIALIVIVIFGGFTGFGGDTMDAQSKIYWSGSARPFSVTEWTQINDTLYMKIKNRETQRLILKNITVGTVIQNMGTAGWSFKSGSSKMITVTGLTQCNSTSYDYFEYNLTFIYDTTDISNMTQKGVKPIAGNCEEA